MRRLLLLIAPLLVLTGCRSTYQAFEGNAPDAVVLIVGEEFRVTEIDGRKVGEPLEIALLPGDHTLRCFFIHRTYTSSGSRRGKSESGTVRFRARADHVYRLHYKRRMVGGRKMAMVAVSEAPVTDPTKVRIISFGKPDSAAKREAANNGN